MPTRFSPRRPFIKPTGVALEEENFFQLKGLNLYDPDETMDDSQSPYAQNFRLYAPSSLSKRVAISKRNGHAFYSTPVGETVHTSFTTTTGAADQTIGVANYLAMKFTTSGVGNISRVDLNLKNSTGTGPIIVQIQSDNGGVPSGTVLATTSIATTSITGSYAYVSARFMEAPAVATTTSYWVVAYTQVDGTNTYSWSSSTASSLAMTSSSGNSWASAAFSLDYKVYFATTGSVKGLTRFYTSTASPKTVFAFNTDVYTVNDGTGAVTSIKGSLNASATYYDWATVNNKLYWVNGLDAPQVYDNTTVAATAAPTVAQSNVELHVNRLFYLSATDPNKLIFTDAAAYETIQSTSFIYVPAVNTADPCLKIVSFQGNLTVFTRNRKYTLFGTDLTSFQLKESPAKKGAAGATAVTTDGQFIYFLSDDGVYKYNGGYDQLLSKNVEPIIQNIADKTKVEMNVRDNKLFIYYRSSGQAFNNNVLIYDIKYNDWVHDTGVYLQTGISWSSQSDTNQFVQSSSMIGVLYYGEMGTSDLGKPIQFEYRTKYHSFKHPAAKHRVKRWYPALRGQGQAFYVDCQFDFDEANSPTSNLVSTNTSVVTWGSGITWGGGSTWGSSVLAPTRITIPGNNRKHQFRFVQNGVDNPVDILGYTVYVQPRRPI